MKRKAYLVVAVMFLAAMTFATAAKAAMTFTTDRRVALVIGNSAYRNATHLPNTINDANTDAALFRSVGFEVVNSRTDLGVLDTGIFHSPPARTKGGGDVHSRHARASSVRQK